MENVMSKPESIHFDKIRNKINTITKHIVSFQLYLNEEDQESDYDGPHITIDDLDRIYEALNKTNSMIEDIIQKK